MITSCFIITLIIINGPKLGIKSKEYNSTLPNCMSASKRQKVFNGTFYIYFRSTFQELHCSMWVSERIPHRKWLWEHLKRMNYTLSHHHTIIYLICHTHLWFFGNWTFKWKTHLHWEALSKILRIRYKLYLKVFMFLFCL